VIELWVGLHVPNVSSWLFKVLNLYPTMCHIVYICTQCGTISIVHAQLFVLLVQNNIGKCAEQVVGWCSCIWTKAAVWISVWGNFWI